MSDYRPLVLSAGRLKQLPAGGRLLGTFEGQGNKIINGCCRIAQRGSTPFLLNANTYGGCDRINVAPAGFTTASGTIAQIAADTASGLAQSVTMTATGTGNIFFLERTEANDTKSLNGKTVTISARVYQDTGAAISASLRLYKANSTDTYSAITKIGADVGTTSVASGVPTNISAQVTLGASDASNGLAAYVVFSGVGAVTARTFWIGDFALHEGDVAVPFGKLMRSYAQELMLCLRYLPSISAGGAQIGDCGFGFVNSSTVSSQMFCSLPAPARVAPTGVVASGAGHINLTNGDSGVTSTSIALLSASTNAARLAIGHSARTAFQPHSFYFNTANAYVLFTGCEL